jgi:trehalose/maltose hydrolase-like predicted phosphorylase
VIQGYGGLRARATRLDYNPVLPPHIKTVKFTRLGYAGTVYSLEYDQAEMTVTVHEMKGATKKLFLCTPIGSSNCKLLTTGEPMTATRSSLSLASAQL